jgi:hypothetical protein
MSAEKIREAALSGDVEYLRRNSKKVGEFLLKCRRATEYDDGGVSFYAACWPGREMLQALYDAGGDFDEGAIVAAIDSVNLDAIAFLAELAQRGDWAARFVPLEDFDEMADIGLRKELITQDDFETLHRWKKENKSLLDSTQCSTSGRV